MTDAEMATLIRETTGFAYLFVGLVGLLYFFASVKEDGGPRRWERYRDHFTRRRTVNHYDDDGPDTYVEAPAPRRRSNANFRHSPPEAEAEATTEAAAENEHAFVTLTEIALQERDADNVEAGMIRAFAALHKGGYLVEGKATEIKRALFGAGGGRKLQALNKAIAAVELAEADAPPPITTPVALRPTATQAWAGELAKEEHA